MNLTIECMDLSGEIAGTLTTTPDGWLAEVDNELLALGLFDSTLVGVYADSAEAFRAVEDWRGP